MKATVLVDANGSVTIPAAILEALRIGPGVEVVVEATPEGILMRPTWRMEIEDYTEERIAEFASDEAALAVLFANRPARD
jgi:AbrB family looped-hinge helix DNA binding protein